MRNLLIIALCFIFFPGLAVKAQLVHEENSTLYGAYVGDIIKTDSFLIVGTAGGIYRSADNGDTWNFTSVVDGQPYVTEALRLLSHTGRLLAFANKDMYVSQNNGKTWAHRDYQANDSFQFSFVDRDKNAFFIQNRLFVQLQPHNYQVHQKMKLVYSDDFGKTWTVHSYYNASSEYYYTAVGDQWMMQVFVNNDSLAFSRDGFQFMPFSTANLNIDSRIHFYGDTNDLYTFSRFEFAKYNYATASWDVNGNIMPGYTNSALWMVSDTLVLDMVLAGSHRVFVSKDKGASWTPLLFFSLDVPGTIRLLYSDGRIFAGNQAGLFSTNVLGSSWAMHIAGMYNLGIALYKIGNRVFGMTMFQVGEIDTLNFRFKPVTYPGWDTSRIRMMNPGKQVSYFVSADVHFGNNLLWRSSDQGKTWTEFTNFPDTLEKYFLAAQDNFILYRGNYPNNKNYFSDDTGQTWVILDTMGITGVPSVRVTDNHIFLLQYDYKILKNKILKYNSSTRQFDSAQTRVPGGFYIQEVGDSLYYLPYAQKPGVYDTIFVYRSGSWYPLQVSGLSGLRSDIYFQAQTVGDSIYILSGSDMFVSGGTMQTWVNQSPAVTDGSLLSSMVKFSSGRMYGTHNYGIFRTGAPVGIMEPKVIQVGKAFPVPATHSITIPWSGAQGSTLSVIDIQGRQQDAFRYTIYPGKVHLDIGGLKPGIYFFIGTDGKHTEVIEP